MSFVKGGKAVLGFNILLFADCVGFMFGFAFKVHSWLNLQPDRSLDSGLVVSY